PHHLHHAARVSTGSPTRANMSNEMLSIGRTLRIFDAHALARARTAADAGWPGRHRREPSRRPTFTVEPGRPNMEGPGYYGGMNTEMGEPTPTPEPAEAAPAGAAKRPAKKAAKRRAAKKTAKAAAKRRAAKKTAKAAAKRRAAKKTVKRAAKKAAKKTAKKAAKKTVK